MADERQSTSFEPITTWSAITAPRTAQAPRHASESSGRWPALGEE